MSSLTGTVKAAKPSFVNTFCTSLVQCWKGDYKRHEDVNNNDSNDDKKDKDSRNTSPTTTNIIHNHDNDSRLGSVAESTSGEIVATDVVEGDDVKDHVGLDDDSKSRGTWNDEDKDADNNNSDEDNDGSSNDDSGGSCSDDSVVIVTNHSVAI